MVWSQLDVNKPHLVYIILGGFTTLFMLCSSVIKERLYIGEATVATLCGIIFGPHAANLIDPNSWGNTDQITLEFSRVVLVVQCFAVGVELPRAYMERHWRSVVFLLVPVMTFGWLITSLFVWALLGKHLNFLDSLVCAACVTATDPVLASSVVGKGKFAKRVPKHLRDLLSAESGCNDGMAFPFIYLALYLVRYRPHGGTVTWHWIGITILYECIFGAMYGVFVGYAARRAIRYAHDHDIIDRESFLVFYFVLALFCAGSGSILGIDDLLVGFACGVGFSNDGWFLEKTEETHVSNVIDLLINLAFFVYFGTIIPWEQFNSALIGTSPWRLVVIALLVLFFRRIPIMMALKPLIPDIKTWREALFAGHFGPIGVGAIFVAIMARAELETESTTPLAVLPTSGEHINIVRAIWPITTFLVMASIIVHGSSIAVFTLGKHINTLTITMSYTQAQDEGNWMDRLPRIQSRSKTNTSLRRPDASEESLNEKLPDYPAAALGLPRNFLRRQKEDDTPSRASSVKTKRRKWDAGPIEQSAIAPQPRREDSNPDSDNERSGSDTIALKSEESPDTQGEERKPRSRRRDEAQMEVYEEGKDTVIEDEEGNVLEVMESRRGETEEQKQERVGDEVRHLMSDEEAEEDISGKRQSAKKGPDLEGRLDHVVGKAGHGLKDAAQRKESGGKGLRRQLTGTWGGLKREKSHRQREDEVPQEGQPRPHRSGPARAFRFGRTIIVEDEDGEVIKTYSIPAPERKKLERNTSYVDPDKTRQRLHRMGTWLGVSHETEEAEAGPSDSKPPTHKKKVSDDDDDRRIRFTMDGQTQRMNKADFIKQIQSLDPRSRAQIVEWSDAPEPVKEEARADAQEHDLKKRRASEPNAGKSKARDGEQVAGIQKMSSNEDRPTGPEGLTLVDSNNQDIPFHSFSEDLRGSRQEPETAAQRRRRAAAAEPDSYFDSNPRGSTGVQETAAERRRQAALAETQADSDDDGTERIPPTRHNDSITRARSHSSPHRSNLDQGETAAERRRREGALGVSKEESDSDEDESRPREPPPNAVPHRPAEVRGPGIRFADEEPKAGASRLRWGQNRGR